MSNLGSTSSDLLIGKNFLKKLLYVQRVDEEKDTVSETPDRYLEEYLIADRTNFHDSKFTKYLKSPKANLSILKLSMKDVIMEVIVYTNPLDIRVLPENDVTIHAFVVVHLNHKCTWWSLEKNGLHIVLQQSTNKEDVINKIYDTEKKTSVERLLPIKQEQEAIGWKDREVKDLLRTIWDNNQISEPYHIATSNCQHFASFICENTTGERWTTEIVERIGLKNPKIQPKIQVDAFKYKTIVNDEKFDFYRALMEERMEDFEKLIKEMTIESSNSVDSEGSTLLEWATVFSSSDWPIDEELKKKGATIPSDEGTFRRNVFFIALQYLPPNQKSKFLSFDGIDIHGVANKTGDTALHLALYGEEWELAEEILKRFESYDVNITNSVGDTPLHLAARLDCEFGLFKKIVNRTNSENVNKTNGNGNTALHYVIINKSEMATKELLARSDVNVDIKNKDHESALLLASTMRMNFPSDLYKLILEKSKEINAQDKDGWTALHDAICRQSEIMTKSLLAHNDVNVNFKDKNNCTPLHLASKWEYIPCDLFKLILERSTDVINAQNDDGWTALHFAILFKSEIATKELLVHSDVDVNVKTNHNDTALIYASQWEGIPVDLYKLILEKSTDVINAQDEYGHTALHWAIFQKSKISTKALLKHKDVDVNVQNNDNETAIDLASKWTYIPIDLFKIILEKSTDINSQNIMGDTALHYAIISKSEIATKELLAHNDVNVNVKNKDHETALHLACKWKDMPMDLFKLILEKTIDINAKDKDGRTALHYAILHQSKTHVEELLKHKEVNVNVENDIKRTPLHLACYWWKDIPVDLFNLILEKSTNINTHDKDGETALHLAISFKSEIATKELLKHKDVNVKVENKNNETALHLASKWKDIPGDLFKIILEKSTTDTNNTQENVNKTDENGCTALHYAIDNQCEIQLEELLKRDDMDVNVKNNYERIALHLASKWTDIPVDLFKLILEKSTDINAQDEEGDTALHLAIHFKSEIMTKALLAHKDVDVNVKTNHNDTALSYVSEWEDIPSDLFKLISERSTNDEV